MTAEELERLILGRDLQTLVDALAPLDESERRKLSKCPVAILRRVKRQQLDGWQPSSPGERFIEYAQYVELAAALAVLGVCAWTDVQRVGLMPWPVSNMGQYVYSVLKARRPEWVGKWVEKNLASDWPDWQVIRKLVRDGVCPRPTSDAYVIAMVRTHAGWNQQRNTPLTSYLREDRGLLEHEIWRMFEVDFGRHGVLAGGEIGSPTAYSWSAALIELSQSGDIDRGRLLTASLQALGHQQHAANASWFYRFHAKLEPSPDERSDRQAMYCDLLASALPAVVGFALDALKVLALAGRLDVERFADLVGPVFELRPKGHPAAAVKLLRIAAKQRPDLAGRIALAAARGLGHSAPEVQKACLDLIQSLAVEVDGPLAEAVGAQRDHVAASLRPAVEALLAKAGAAETQAPAVESGSEIAELLREDELLEPKWRAIAGVDACVKAMQSGGDIPAVEFDPMAVPRLAGRERLRPIESLDELIDRLSAAVESLEDADELELLLDGLSRMADQRPEGFEQRTAPLLKRVGDVLGPTGWPSSGQICLLRLIRAWLQNKPLAPWTDQGLPIAVVVIEMRISELSQRLQRRSRAPLLCCPTHHNCWIEPTAFVGRLEEHQRIGQTPGRFDLIQAMLRLAPDGRDAALRAAGQLNGQVGAVVRFALGGEIPANSAAVDAPDGALWVAAGRARSPDAAFDGLPGVNDAGPDTLCPARYAWEIRKCEGYDYQFPEGFRLDVTVNRPVPDHQTGLDQPTALLHHYRYDRWMTDTVLNIRCRFAMWPANPNATLARGAAAILSRLGSPASTFSPFAHYLEPLFDPDTPLSEMARLCLCLALLSKDAGAKGMAVDAMIVLIADGRCVGDELGPIYAKLAATKDVLRLNRLAEALGEVARVSALHRHVATRAAMSTLAALRPPAPDDLHHLLSPLREWLTASGAGLAEAARPILESVTGSGKTASLAKALLGTAGGGKATVRNEIYAAALRGRIERARRWEERVRPLPT